jgi:hypothetical protein
MALNPPRGLRALCRTAHQRTPLVIYGGTEVFRGGVLCTLSARVMIPAPRRRGVRLPLGLLASPEAMRAWRRSFISSRQTPERSQRRKRRSDEGKHPKVRRPQHEGCEPRDPPLSSRSWTGSVRMTSDHHRAPKQSQIHRWRASEATGLGVRVVGVESA